MKKLLEAMLRPFALALGVFSLLNLPVAWLEPRLSGTRLWLDFPFAVPEPYLSLASALLGIVLLLPHRVGRWSPVRYGCGVLIIGFTVAVGWNIHDYYVELAEGRIGTDLPLPFSLFILVVRVAELSRHWWWEEHRQSRYQRLRFARRGTTMVTAFFLLMFFHNSSP